MSYSQLINLFLLFSLISYSYQYNRQNNYIRRRTRDTDLKYAAQSGINIAISDQEELGNEIQKSIQKDADTLKIVTRSIIIAANKMAQAGVTNITSIALWTEVQNQLRSGLNTITDAYRRYIEFHRKTCDDIENHVRNMITKYETEISTLNQLSAPIIADGISDPTNPVLIDWFGRMNRFMSYADVQHRTLGTALDCVHDLARRTIEQQQIIMGPSITRTVTFHVIHQEEPQNLVRSYDLPCNELNGYNGCQNCARSVAALTQRYADYAACPAQCLSPSPLNINYN